MNCTRQLFSFLFSMVFICVTVTNLQAQGRKLTPEEKKTLLTNLDKVLADVKNDFKSIATGEMKEWKNKKFSFSKVQLLPAWYALEKNYSISYGKDDINQEVQNNYFLEIPPFSITEMHAALAATLKAKGFTEVQPQRPEAIDTIRAFRSKEAVVVLKGAKDMIEKETYITIGKFYYYYANNVLAVKPTVSTRNKNEFSYQHPCGLRASGKFIAGDTLIEGKIIFCTNNSKEPTSFTGIYVSKGYLPRTYIGNASGNMPMKLEMVKGKLEFAKFGAVFTGDFVEKNPSSTLFAKGYMVANGDSVNGYLHKDTGYEPPYFLTPVDKNKKRIRLYSDYQGKGQPKLVYEDYTVAEEEKEWADIELRIKNRQMNMGSGNSGGSGGAINNSPGYGSKADDATAARNRLYAWIRENDKARLADVTQCIKDRGYGAGIARMSGHCKRAEAYFKEHNDKCYNYLKEYEKYTPAADVSDIKARMKAVVDASNGMK